MTACEFLEMMDRKTWEFVISDNPPRTPRFYNDIYLLIVSRWPWARKHLK
jgi:hypothetical protein